MIESILEKAIQGIGQSNSYSPQQVAEMLDNHAKNIEMLDIRITFTWWILLLIIIAFAVIFIISIWRLEKQLKLIKKSMYR